MESSSCAQSLNIVKRKKERRRREEGEKKERRRREEGKKKDKFVRYTVNLGDTPSYFRALVPPMPELFWGGRTHVTPRRYATGLIYWLVLEYRLYSAS